MKPVLATFCFHGLEFSGKPGSSMWDRDRLRFHRSKTVEDVVEAVVVMSNQIIRGGVIRVE